MLKSLARFTAASVAAAILALPLISCGESSTPSPSNTSTPAPSKVSYKCAACGKPSPPRPRHRPPLAEGRR